LDCLANNLDGWHVTDRDPAWIDHAGVRLRYTLNGSGATGAVLIHELGGSIDSWDAVVAGLERSMQLLRYDQRGHGGSTMVQAPYAIADHAGDLLALIDQVAVARPCWLIAAAAGAAIAVEFAARYPSRVAGIVMCAPALDVDRSRRRQLRNRAAAVTRNGMTAIVDTVLSRSWPPMLRCDMRAFARYRERLLANDPRSFALANLALSHIDLSARLPSLRCPCLFLAGEHDLQRPPRHVAAQASLVSRAEFDVVPAGHLMAVQRPGEVVAQILAFITGQGSRP
jgi:3-oxoadipate enol-lactonase